VQKKTSFRQNPEFLKRLYRRMLFFRRFEERVHIAYTKRKYSGFCHLHIGQEAVLVGTQENLRRTDYSISSYRSHTQAIAKGVPAKDVFSELFGKVTGCSRGKGGSMHMFSKEHRFLGGHGIVGGQAPIASGVAFAIKYRQLDEIIVCYIGDAAINQGQFMEALNMATVWNLPVLYLIENNRYGMGTNICRTTALENLHERASGFNLAHSHVDGMDVLAVYNKVKEVVEDIRQTSRPYLLEALTYRYHGHSVSDPAHYRTQEELENYRRRDPIIQLAKHLQDLGFATEDELKQLNKVIKAEVREAETFADEAQVVDKSEVLDHVFTPYGTH